MPPVGSPSSHPPSSIDFPRLINILSRSPALPCSLHVRNTLLGALNGQEQSSAPSKYPIDHDWWKQLKEYQVGCQVAILGNPPQDVCNHTTSTGEQQGTWGIVILKPSVSRDDPLSYIERCDLSIWINAESDHAYKQQSLLHEQGIEDVFEVSVEESRIMDWVLSDWVPKAYEQLVTDVQTHFGLSDVEIEQQRSSSGGTMDTILFGMDPNVFAAVCNKIGDKTRNHSKKGVEWGVTYGTYQRPWYPEGSAEKSTVRVIDHLQAGQTDRSRWQLERLDERNVETVLSSNKLAFPKSHLLRKPFLTCLLRDGTGPSTDEDEPSAAVLNTYPSVQAKGAPAGWCYTHDDLGLASLHVATPYRRLQSAITSTSASPTVPAKVKNQAQPENEEIVITSLGRTVVDIMSQYIATQERASLTALGLDLEELRSACSASLSAIAGHPRPSVCPWSIVADVALDDDSAGSRAFYRKIGFHEIGRRCWGGVKLQVQPDKDDQ